MPDTICFLLELDFRRNHQPIFRRVVHNHLKYVTEKAVIFEPLHNQLLASFVNLHLGFKSISQLLFKLELRHRLKTLKALAENPKQMPGLMPQSSMLAAEMKTHACFTHSIPENKEKSGRFEANLDFTVSSPSRLAKRRRTKKAHCLQARKINQNHSIQV